MITLCPHCNFKTKTLIDNTCSKCRMPKVMIRCNGCLKKINFNEVHICDTKNKKRIDCLNNKCDENHNNECERYFEGQPKNCPERSEPSIKNKREIKSNRRFKTNMELVLSPFDD